MNSGGTGDGTPGSAADHPSRSARDGLPSHPTSALVAALLLIAACATTADLREARGTGLTRDFEGSFEDVFTAAVESVRGLGLEVDRVNEEERWIAATRYPDRMGPGAPEEAVSIQADQGERVGVFVDSVAPGRWNVEVVTRRMFALDPSKLEWAQDIFFSMESRLEPGPLRRP